MDIIRVSHLSKHYRIYKKSAGLGGSFKSLFHRQYRDSKAVDDISFTIKEGELIGFIGPNGAGKTTTLKCLSGLLYPTAGEVIVLDHIPFERKSSFLKQISLVMGQKNQLWWDLPAEETFLLNKEIYEIDERVYRGVVGELTEMLDVKDILNVQVRKLSLGQRMKCELIAALLHSPKVLFLDEPTIGLDVVMQKNLRQFIKEYNRRYKATILLTSHYMGDVEELCRRVIIIDNGAIIYDGLLADIVKKYAKNKLLTVYFNQPVAKDAFKNLGEVKESTPLKIRLAVPQEKSNQAAAHILQNFPVKDITITDPEIEAIIRHIFSKQS